MLVGNVGVTEWNSLIQEEMRRSYASPCSSNAMFRVLLAELTGGRLLH